MHMMLFAVLKVRVCYVQVLISLAFQQRLTEYLHECYLSNRVYYVASTLRGLSNADQVCFSLFCRIFRIWTFQDLNLERMTCQTRNLENKQSFFSPLFLVLLLPLFTIPELRMISFWRVLEIISL